jgi:hypothetical protein
MGIHAAQAGPSPGPGWPAKLRAGPARPNSHCAMSCPPTGCGKGPSPGLSCRFVPGLLGIARPSGATHGRPQARNCTSPTLPTAEQELRGGQRRRIDSGEDGGRRRRRSGEVSSPSSSAGRPAVNMCWEPGKM